MNIFISWSGTRSKQVAEFLNEWIQCVIQAVNPWLSSKDIDRGALWFSEITDQLANTNVGIICLTKENKNKPWILFEAGALAKGLSSSKVCTFLIDLKPTDLENPLAQFNHTEPSKEGLWNLLSTINRSLGEKSLKEQILERVFDTYFPEFTYHFNKIIKGTPDVEAQEVRKEPEILLEVLTTIRALDKRMTYLEVNNTQKLEEIYMKMNNRILNENNTMSKVISEQTKKLSSLDALRKKIQESNDVTQS
jgi:hypothetical protein